MEGRAVLPLNPEIFASSIFSFINFILIFIALCLIKNRLIVWLCNYFSSFHLIRIISSLVIDCTFQIILKMLETLIAFVILDFRRLLKNQNRIPIKYLKIIYWKNLTSKMLTILICFKVDFPWQNVWYFLNYFVIYLFLC